MFRKILVLLAVGFVLPGWLYALGNSEGRAKPLTIHAISGPSGVGMIRLFEDPPQIPGFNVKMEAIADGANLIAGRFLSGEAQIGVLPPQVAAKIRAQGRDIQALAIIGNGMLSLLSSDPAVRGIADLRGRTLEMAGQGATPEFVFRTILAANGINPDRDVTMGFSLAYPEIALSLISGNVSTALLPEPFATMALNGNRNLRSVIDVQQEWSRAVGGTAGNVSNYPMTLLVADSAFAAANPVAVKEILNAVRASSEWVRANPADAGILVEKHDLGLKAAVVEAAIPRSNYVFIPAAEGRASLEALFNVFLKNDPESIGGALPDDGFYWGSN